MTQISRRLSHCILKGEFFERGSEYISYLDADGQRWDYCPHCWEKIEKPKEGHFWKGKIPPKKEKVLHPDEKALQLFRHVEDPKQKYVLALYLQRNQQIVKRTKTLFEVPETGEVFDVARMVLEKEEGERVAKELNELLN